MLERSPSSLQNNGAPGGIIPNIGFPQNYTLQPQYLMNQQQQHHSMLQFNDLTSSQSSFNNFQQQYRHDNNGFAYNNSDSFLTQTNTNNNQILNNNITWKNMLDDEFNIKHLLNFTSVISQLPKLSFVNELL